MGSCFYTCLRFTIYDLNWVHDDTTLMKIRQDSSVHVAEILLVPSPDEGGGHQGEKTLILDRSNKKKKKRKKKSQKKRKIDKKEKKKKEKKNEMLR